MTEENKKTILQRPFIVFFYTLIGLAILLTILAMFDVQNLSTVIGVYFLYGGIIVIIIGFVFLNKGGNSSATSLSHLKNNEQFKKTRKEEKPFERIVFAVILAGFLIAAVGYFLVRVMSG